MYRQNTTPQFSGCLRIFKSKISALYTVMILLEFIVIVFIVDHTMSLKKFLLAAKKAKLFLKFLLLTKQTLENLHIYN